MVDNHVDLKRQIEKRIVHVNKLLARIGIMRSSRFSGAQNFLEKYHDGLEEILVNCNWEGGEIPYSEIEDLLENSPFETVVDLLSTVDDAKEKEIYSTSGRALLLASELKDIASSYAVKESKENTTSTQTEQNRENNLRHEFYELLWMKTIELYRKTKMQDALRLTEQLNALQDHQHLTNLMLKIKLQIQQLMLLNTSVAKRMLVELQKMEISLIDDLSEENTEDIAEKVNHIQNILNNKKQQAYYSETITLQKTIGRLQRVVKQSPAKQFQTYATILNSYSTPINRINSGFLSRAVIKGEESLPSVDLITLNIIVKEIENSVIVHNQHMEQLEEFNKNLLAIIEAIASQPNILQARLPELRQIQEKANSIVDFTAADLAFIGQNTKLLEKLENLIDAVTYTTQKLANFVKLKPILSAAEQDRIIKLEQINQQLLAAKSEEALQNYLNELNAALTENGIQDITQRMKKLREDIAKLMEEMQHYNQQRKLSIIDDNISSLSPLIDFDNFAITMEERTNQFNLVRHQFARMKAENDKQQLELQSVLNRDAKLTLTLRANKMLQYLTQLKQFNENDKLDSLKMDLQKKLQAFQSHSFVSRWMNSGAEINLKKAYLASRAALQANFQSWSNENEHAKFEELGRKHHVNVAALSPHIQCQHYREILVLELQHLACAESVGKQKNINVNKENDVIATRGERIQRAKRIASYQHTTAADLHDLAHITRRTQYELALDVPKIKQMPCWEIIGELNDPFLSIDQRAQLLLLRIAAAPDVIALPLSQTLQTLYDKKQNIEKEIKTTILELTHSVPNEKKNDKIAQKNLQIQKVKAKKKLVELKKKRHEMENTLATAYFQCIADNNACKMLMQSAQSQHANCSKAREIYQAHFASVNTHFYDHAFAAAMVAAENKGKKLRSVIFKDKKSFWQTELQSLESKTSDYKKMDAIHFDEFIHSDDYIQLELQAKTIAQQMHDGTYLNRLMLEHSILVNKIVLLTEEFNIPGHINTNLSGAFTKLNKTFKAWQEAKANQDDSLVEATKEFRDALIKYEKIKQEDEQLFKSKEKELAKLIIDAEMHQDQLTAEQKSGLARTHTVTVVDHLIAGFHQLNSNQEKIEYLKSQLGKFEKPLASQSQSLKAEVAQLNKINHLADADLINQTVIAVFKGLMNVLKPYFLKTLTSSNKLIELLDKKDKKNKKDKQKANQAGIISRLGIAKEVQNNAIMDIAVLQHEKTLQNHLQLATPHHLSISGNLDQFRNTLENDRALAIKLAKNYPTFVDLIQKIDDAIKRIDILQAERNKVPEVPVFMREPEIKEEKNGLRIGNLVN